MTRLLKSSLACTAMLTLLFSARDARARVDMQLVSCALTQDVCPSGGPGHLNGSVEPGEEGYFVITVRNAGDETATNVDALADSGTTGMTVTVNQLPLPNIPAGATVTQAVPFEFFVDGTVSCGTSLVFNLTVTSTQQVLSRISCSIPVPVPCTVCLPAAALSLVGCTPTDTCGLGGAGNNDGSVDPGESVTVRLRVQNTGGAPATNVRAVVTTATPGVTIGVGTATFPNIAAGGTENGDNVIDFTVDETVACGTDVVLSVEIQSDQGSRTEACILHVPAACNPCVAAPVLDVNRCSATDDCPIRPGANFLLDPGETADIEAQLINRGTAQATNVVVTMTTTTPGVTITRGSATYGTIAPAAAVGPAVPHAISLAPSVPCGTTVVLDLIIQSDQGNTTGTCTFVVPAACAPCTAGPALGLQTCSATDDCAIGGAGDGNGSVEPGETAAIRLSVTNAGGGDATNVVATISTSTPGVAVTQPTATFGTVAAGATAGGNVPVTITVDLSVTCGTSIVIDVSIASDQGTFSDTCILQVPVPCQACTAGPALSLAACGAVDSCAFGGPGDGDGSIDPGETADVAMALRNTGVASATNVTIVVTSTTPGVTVTQGSASFGTIAAGATVAGDVPIAISVSSVAPCGMTIVLDIAISSDQGNSADACTLLIPTPCTPCTPGGGPGLEVSGCSPVDDCAAGGAGDGDGSVDPGETADVTITVSNTGTTGATSVSATVTTATPGVTITQGSTSFGNIAAGGSADGLVPVEFTLGSLVPCGTTIVLDVLIQSDQGNRSTTCSIVVPVPCTPCTGGGGNVEEVPWILPRCVGGNVQMEWLPAVNAVTYGIHRGTLAIFAGGPPDYDHGCAVSGLVPPLVALVPGSTCGDGADEYYLVVGLDAAGNEGPYGFADVDHDAVGDTPRPAGTPPCP